MVYEKLRNFDTFNRAQYYKNLDSKGASTENVCSSDALAEGLYISLFIYVDDIFVIGTLSDVAVAKQDLSKYLDV